MYGSRGSTGVVTAAGGGGALASTGFPLVGLTILAIALVIIGVALVRMAVVKRARDA